MPGSPLGCGPETTLTKTSDELVAILNLRALALACGAPGPARAGVAILSNTFVAFHR
jgi:hypothetical protein